MPNQSPSHPWPHFGLWSLHSCHHQTPGFQCLVDTCCHEQQQQQVHHHCRCLSHGHGHFEPDCQCQKLVSRSRPPLRCWHTKHRQHHLHGHCLQSFSCACVVCFEPTWWSFDHVSWVVCFSFFFDFSVLQCLSCHFFLRLCPSKQWEAESCQREWQEPSSVASVTAAELCQWTPSSKNLRHNCSQTESGHGRTQMTAGNCTGSPPQVAHWWCHPGHGWCFWQTWEKGQSNASTGNCSSQHGAKERVAVVHPKLGSVWSLCQPPAQGMPTLLIFHWDSATATGKRNPSN